MSGREEESEGVRPLTANGAKFDRYTQAIRMIDRPSLFVNRPSFRLLDVARTAGRPKLSFGYTTYFDRADVCEGVAHELASACLKTGSDPAWIGDPSWAELPFRALVGDPFDLAHRPLLPSIDTLGEQPCGCHGLRYLFGGHSAANGAASRPGAKLADVARVAGVSTGTVSNVLNRPAAVAEATRAAVEKAMADLGFIRFWSSGESAAHWRRNGFATWLFQPAATGWYPKKAPQEARPVPLRAEPWPGIPARGRGAAARAEASWVPIARGLTPHGLRHSHKTMMDELRTPPKLKDERMGHEDGSVQARYSHITPEMRRELLGGLTGM